MITSLEDRMLEMSAHLPRLIAFDLDYTLWDLWLDTHVTGPLYRHNDTLNEVLDKYKYPIKFYHEVPQILHRLRASEVTIAACSRTDAPRLARQALGLLLVPSNTHQDDPLPAVNFFHHLEIYPGSKLAHFKKLHEKTGIPYSDMLFFDDEHRNSEVEKLGVTFVLVPRGVNHAAFEKGLAKWRKRHALE
ncbi:putative magnesium-dependent phosphatase P8B7.31 [Hypsizygus marmoreus]|uniref:Magnesium-dependent phosphatase P8B7.31 n=1 Tax=Hypsizygus marmoreus TaxID=39966 RepID=A0A369JIL6_HYPMA|nr:putative magnesium-dependent phosphatase P8B7.31 [Hypsizygus marmoreus]